MATPVQPTPAFARLRLMPAPLHTLLTVQSLVVVLASVNRLGPFTTGFVAPNEFLRWVDLINMLVLPLASVVAFALLRRWLERRPEPGAPTRALTVLDLAFQIGVYLFAAGYGAHEVTNYLHVRFCLPEVSRICEIIAFNDDQFSHWVFFGGFLLLNATLLALETRTPRARLGVVDTVPLVTNGLFVAAAIYANLALEVTGLDLPVVSVLVVYVVAVAARFGIRPLVVYYGAGYGIGLAASLLFKLAS